MRRRNADRVKDCSTRSARHRRGPCGGQIQEREEAKLEEQEETQAYVEYEAYMRDVAEEREHGLKPVTGSSSGRWPRSGTAKC